jgi:hypothetical protein
MRDGTENRVEGQSDGDEEGVEKQRVGTFPFRTTLEARDVGPDQDGDDAAGASDDQGIDPPWYVRWVGQIGVYLGVLGVTLAAAGVTLAWQGIQPYGNIGITFSLVFSVLAMILGTVFQVYRSDLDVPRPS